MGGRTWCVRNRVLPLALTGMLANVHGASEPPQLAPAVLRSSVVINIPQQMLFLMAEGGIVARYPVAVGRPDWPTFEGAFLVVATEIDPVWDVPASIQEEQRPSGQRVLTRVPPGPSNPLGKYSLGLSVPAYGIHGTNDPSSISQYQTHGCIRMLAADIEDLFARVDVGTPGLSVYEPIIVGTVDGNLWMEVHRDVYRRDGRDAVGYITIDPA